MQTLMASLGKLNKLHTSLYELAVLKTEAIKQGAIEELDKLLKEEQKHVTAINMVEKERAGATIQFLDELGIGKDSFPTLSDCIEAADDHEKVQLKEMQTSLVEVIDDLRYQNELNQQLIQQSLQFVNMNLSMIQPQPDQMNYGRNQQEMKNAPRRSMFDSKA